jgi:hypothetical protein
MSSRAKAKPESRDPYQAADLCGGRASSPAVRNRNVFGLAFAAWLLTLLLLLTSCRSPGTTVQIVNQTSGPVRTIEVIYPGGSYGIGQLPRGSSHAKWIKPNADAALQISFLDAAGQKHLINKVTVKRGYAGGLAIVLLPEGQIQVEDHTHPGSKPH